MSREVDALLKSLLNEIPASPQKPVPAPPKPTETAFRKAEQIVQDVEQEKSWQIPPEPPKPEIPAPQHDPVVVPQPVSHFTDVPSANPAIRMRDRLDETSLPKPDAERKPTQIMEARPKPAPGKKKKRRPSGTTLEDVRRMIPDRPKTQETAPKRSVPHITVPDELPPDITPEPARQEEVRSRAELIREQLRKRSEEISAPSAPVQETAPPMPDEIRMEDEQAAMMKSIRQQVNKAFAQEQRRSEADASAQKAPALRHLSVQEQPEQTAKPSFFGRFRQKKEQSGEESREEDTPTDWRTLVASPSAEGFREIVNVPDAPEDAEEDDPIPSVPETPPMPPQPAPETDPEKLPVLEHPPMPDPETPPMPPQSFAEVLREAFDETAEELAEIKAEPLPEQHETLRVHFLKRHSYFLAGIVCFVLALVGLVTCIRWGWGQAQRFAGSASLKQELEDVLYPVAVVDLPAFETPGELSAESLLSAAMVDILMYEDLSGYPENFDVISIPAGDVLARAQAMFGTDFTVNYDTLHAAGETFYYDSASGCYNVPAAPVIFSYSPEVTRVQRSGDTYTATVRYRSDLARWQERSENFEEGSEKTMQVTFVKSGDSYRITKIANVQTGDGE